jgi:hypothetical protein
MERMEILGMKKRKLVLERQPLLHATGPGEAAAWFQVRVPVDQRMLSSLSSLVYGGQEQTVKHRVKVKVKR